MMIGYYDMILGLIPLSLLGVAGTLHGIGFETAIAVPIAAIVATALVAHAMFVKAPIDIATDASTGPALD